MNKSETTENIYTVLARVWGKLQNPTKDTKGYNYKYATLDQVLDILRPAYSSEGLYLEQRELQVDGKHYLATQIHFGDQHTAESIAEITAPDGKDLGDKQIYGSALTYTRRYSALAISGIFPEDEDDDAATASNQGHKNDRPTTSKFKNFTKEMAEKTTSGITPGPIAPTASQEKPTQTANNAPPLNESKPTDSKATLLAQLITLRRSKGISDKGFKQSLKNNYETDDIMALTIDQIKDCAKKIGAINAGI